MYAAIGRHPNEATGFDDADLAELEALAAHERCVAIGETGPRLLPRLRARAPTSERAFARPDRARARDRQAARDPHARRRRRHARDPVRARRRGQGDPPLLLDGRRGSKSASRTHDWWFSFAGNVTYPKAEELRAAASARPARAAAGRDRRPLSGAPARPRQAQPAGQRRRTPRRRSRSSGGCPTTSSRRRSRRSAAAVFGW